MKTYVPLTWEVNEDAQIVMTIEHSNAGGVLIDFAPIVLPREVSLEVAKRILMAREREAPGTIDKVAAALLREAGK